MWVLWNVNFVLGGDIIFVSSKETDFQATLEVLEV